MKNNEKKKPFERTDDELAKESFKLLLDILVSGKHKKRKESHNDEKYN